MTQTTKKDPGQLIGAVTIPPDRPPAMATWMVARSTGKAGRAAELGEFGNKFEEAIIRTGDVEEARRWAYRFGWERLYGAFKPLIDIGMIVLAVLGFLLAVAGLIVG